jgi:hypothetical protein
MSFILRGPKNHKRLTVNEIVKRFVVKKGKNIQWLKLCGDVADPLEKKFQAIFFSCHRARLTFMGCRTFAS